MKLARSLSFLTALGILLQVQSQRAPGGQGANPGGRPPQGGNAPPGQPPPKRQISGVKNGKKRPPPQGPPPTNCTDM
eukprot:568931-Hanusia_phi.AAC.1